jgi:hypothetical protein
MKPGRLDLMMALVVAALVSIPLRANDSLASARAQYAAAEYEDALATLDRLQHADTSPLDDRRAIAQFRAYCFLALGRDADAEAAIAVVVTATPRYVPADGEVSPRVRNAFREVRQRILPVIIQDRYRAAKAAFDQQRYDVAAAGFTEVLDVVEDPNAAAYFNEPPHSDLKVLAAGFRDLSARAATPAPLAARTTSAPANVNISVGPARIFGAEDLHVLPPVVVQQAVPPFPAVAVPGSHGILDLLIDETGRVEQATLRQGINPAYDKQLLNAARQWIYKPAMARGLPVKYRRMVQVQVQLGAKR